MQTKKVYKHAIPRKLKLTNTSDPDFNEVVLGAAIGLSAKAISELSGYSIHQSRYRISKSGMRITDYRNGNRITVLMLQKLRQDRAAILKIRREIEERLR